MPETPQKFNQRIKKLLFPEDVRKEKKRLRDQKRWKQKIYKRSEVKWNKNNRVDMERYHFTCLNAKKEGLPLASYLKQAGIMSNRPFITKSDLEVLRSIFFESQKANAIAEKIEKNTNFIGIPQAKDLMITANSYRDITKQMESFFLSIKHCFSP